VVQAQQVVAAAATRLPVPVSPAPTERVTGSGPIARRPAKSPLTGEVLMDRAPKV
jgi:hypothetical protein